jgi:hypothetical protein
MVEFLGCTDHWFYIKELSLLRPFALFKHPPQADSGLERSSILLIFLSLKQAYNSSVCTFPVSEITV